MEPYTGECLVPTCTEGCLRFIEVVDSNRCDCCHHHKGQHRPGTLNLATGVVTFAVEPPARAANQASSAVQSNMKQTQQQSTISSYLRGNQVPKFDHTDAEVSHLFLKSAKSASGNVSGKKHSSVDISSKSGTKKHKPGAGVDDSFGLETHVMPLEDRIAVHNETERLLLINRGSIWPEYHFTSTDNLWKELKMSPTGEDFVRSDNYYMYILTGQKRWTPTGCWTRRFPTSSDLRAWNADIKKGKRLFITPECFEEHEKFFSGELHDLTGDDDQPAQPQQQQQQRQQQYQQQQHEVASEDESYSVASNQYQNYTNTSTSYSPYYTPHYVPSNTPSYTYTNPPTNSTISTTTPTALETFLLQSGVVRGSAQWVELMEDRSAPGLRAVGAPPRLASGASSSGGTAANTSQFSASVQARELQMQAQLWAEAEARRVGALL